MRTINIHTYKNVRIPRKLAKKLKKRYLKVDGYSHFKFDSPRLFIIDSSHYSYWVSTKVIK